MSELLTAVTRYAWSTEKVEEEVCDLLAEYLGVKSSEVLLVSSGTAALVVGLEAIRRDANDEVILSTFNCPQVVDAVLRAGMRPVLCDIGADLNLDLAKVERLVTERTIAVIATPTFGIPIDLSGLENLCHAKSIHLIDDAAQTFGADSGGRKFSTHGSFGVLSFGKHKPLFALSGGALIKGKSGTRSGSVRAQDGVRDLLALLGFNYARRISSKLPVRLGLASQPFDDVREALESRRTEVPVERISRFSAELLRAGLPRLDEYSRRNRAYRKMYWETVKDLPGLEMVGTPDSDANFLAFKCRDVSRFELAAACANNGIETSWLYYPLHLQSKYSEFAGESIFPVAGEAWSNTLCLPCRGWHRPEQIAKCCRVLASAYHSSLKKTQLSTPLND